MHIVLVFIKVKPEFLDAFKKATLANAQSSRQEPGVARFDFLQQGDDPQQFVLIEVYKKQEDQAAHRETSHYKKWRVDVEEMMADPRVGVKYINIDPGDRGWVS